MLDKPSEERQNELASELASEHDAQNAIDGRVDHDEEVGDVERVDIGRVEDDAHVAEHEQTENARRELTDKEDDDETYDHDCDVVA